MQRKLVAGRRRLLEAALARPRGPLSARPPPCSPLHVRDSNCSLVPFTDGRRQPTLRVRRMGTSVEDGWRESNRGLRIAGGGPHCSRVTRPRVFTGRCYNPHREPASARDAAEVAAVTPIPASRMRPTRDLPDLPGSLQRLAPLARLARERVR